MSKYAISPMVLLLYLVNSLSFLKNIYLSIQATTTSAILLSIICFFASTGGIVLVCSINRSLLYTSRPILGCIL
jgi:hypothetical protein